MSREKFEAIQEKKIEKLELMVEVHSNLYESLNAFLCATESHPLEEKLTGIMEFVESDLETFQKQLETQKEYTHNESIADQNYEKWKQERDEV